MAEIKSVKIVVEVIVKETDERYFKPDEYEQQRIADAVESELKVIKNEDYRNDWTVLGVQVKKIK